MVAYGEGIDDRVCSLDIVAKKIVKAVLVDTLGTYGTVEAAETSAAEGVVCNIYHTGVVRKNTAEAINHPGKVGVGVGVVGDDNNVLALKLFVILRIGSLLLKVGILAVRIGLIQLVFHSPEEMVKELFCHVSALLGKKVVHICRESLDISETKVATVVLYILVGGHIVEML